MTVRNSLYFRDENNAEFTKTANIDSPAFIGTPLVPTPKKNNNTRITNVEFVKMYINDKIHNLGFHTVSSNTGVLNVYPNKEYIVNVSGLIDMNEEDNIKLGYVVITDINDVVLAKSDNDISSVFNSTGGIVQSGTIRVRVPLNGIIKGYINYGGTIDKVLADYICAIEIDIDEYCNIYINQKEHQTIYVSANGETYSESEFIISKNSVYNVKVVPEIGYIPGTVTPGMSGVIEGDTTFDITNPTYDPCYISIVQTPNQTISVISEEIEYTDSFIGRYGSEFTVVVTPNTGYIPGEPTISEGVITSSISITATPAKAVYKTVSIIQQQHQVITLTRLDTGDTTNTLFSVPLGTRILAEIDVDPAYSPGTLNVDKYFFANDDIVVTSTEPQPR